MAIALRQRSPEWHEARRSLITSTKLPVILGLSPYKSEGQLAREMLGQADPEPESLMMQIGSALEPVIAGAYEREYGVRLRRMRTLVMHPQIEWAAASPDFRRVGERYLVETKNSVSKRWDGVELPQDVEAQVRWALGCTGYAIGDVALLHYGKLRRFTVEHDQKTFDGLVKIAADFRKRLAAGGPFEENAASVKSRWPRDDGTEMVADEETSALVYQLFEWSKSIAAAEKTVEEIETRIKAVMRDASVLVGKGFSVTWKRAKDSSTVDHESIAKAYRELIERVFDDADRGDIATVPFRLAADSYEPVTRETLDAIESLHTAIKPGSRRFTPTDKREKAA